MPLLSQKKYQQPSQKKNMTKANAKAKARTKPYDNLRPWAPRPSLSLDTFEAADAALASGFAAKNKRTKREAKEVTPGGSPAEA